MFICCACNTELTITSRFCEHICTHDLLGQIRLPVKCPENVCGHFSTVANLVRHMNERNRKHLLQFVLVDISF